MIAKVGALRKTSKKQIFIKQRNLLQNDKNNALCAQNAHIKRCFV